MTVIELKDVKKVYGKGEAQVVALNDINFQADKGEVVLIMGPSGAGKSTFDHCWFLAKANFRRDPN